MRGGFPSLLHLDHHAGGMRVELGGVHALDLGDAGLVFAGVLDARAGFKDMGAGRQGQFIAPYPIPVANQALLSF